MKKMLIALFCLACLFSGCMTNTSNQVPETVIETEESDAAETQSPDESSFEDTLSEETVFDVISPSRLITSVTAGEMRIGYPQYDTREAPDFISTLNERFYEKAVSFLSHEGSLPTTYVCEYEMTFDNPALISARYEFYYYASPSANGISACDGITANLKTNEILSFGSFFTDSPELHEYLKHLMKTYLFEEEIGLFDITGFDGIDEDQQFYLTENAFMVVFQPCRYTPHCYGTLEIPIYFEEVRHYLHPDYLELFLPRSSSEPAV